MPRRSSLVFSVLLVVGVALAGFPVRASLQTSITRQDVVKASNARGVANWKDLCRGPETVRLTRNKLCTHGADPAPPGFDVDKRVRPSAAFATNQQQPAIPCDGDGQSGFRVQVLYVRAADVDSRFSQYVSDFKRWAVEANDIIQSSAQATGGSRSLRFVQTGGGAVCEPAVREVVVAPHGDDGFSSLVTELHSQGFIRHDRIYLSFVDSTSANICGVGTIWPDDRADESVNWNNSGPSFSRVDAGCWSGELVAHELMHNLGGVQLSAPNTSGGYHCIDEYDVMCYSDSPYRPAMREDCPNPPYDQPQLDCGHQDYFNTNPDADSYLGNFWNAANNRFLIGAPAVPEPSPPVVDDGPTDEPSRHVEKNKQDKKGKHKSKNDKHKKRNARKHGRR